MRPCDGVKVHRFMRTHASRGGPGVTACIAGMQSGGGQQFAPVAHLFPGKVSAYSYCNRQFDADALIMSVVEDLEPHIGEPIRIVGASMGGAVAPFVVERLRGLYPDIDPALLQVVLVDAPSGADSLFTERARLLAHPAVVRIARWLPRWIQAPVIVPPESEFEVPEDLLTSPEAYRRVARNASIERLSGFPLSLFVDKVGWIMRVYEDGSQARACRSLDGLDVTFIRCHSRVNSVNRKTVDNWCRMADFTLIDVNAAHCGFQQNQPTFDRLFREFAWI